MPAGPAHPPLDAQVTLHAALDGALQRPRWHLGFAPALEARLEADTGARTWSTGALAEYTQAPADPRYRELAERIIAERVPADLRDQDAAKVFAITEWLGEHGIYSQRSQHASAEDPTAHFLFGDRTGYCVHFSHAAAFLFRSVGLPARVGSEPRAHLRDLLAVDPQGQPIRVADHCWGCTAGQGSSCGGALEDTPTAQAA